MNFTNSLFVIILIYMHFIRNSHAIIHFLKEISLCGNFTELRLEPEGFESSRMINLRPSLEYEYCSLSIKAPASTHVIHLQVLEDATLIKLHSKKTPPCILHIYLDDHMKSVWHGDLCSPNQLKSIEMLSSNITIRWKAAYDKFQTRGRKLIVTAVGHNREFCRKPNQHTCMKVGLDPIFCVSVDVTCDGHENCPPGSKSSDEGAFCETDSLWQKRFAGVMNKMPNIASTIRRTYPENSTDIPKMLNDIGKTLNNIKRLTKIETTTKSSVETRSFGSLHDLLAQYDPWGYLFLGVVLCGSLLLMCCGIWECCIRRYKNSITDSSTPRQTVVIVNNYDESNGQQHQQPPNYDDLDLPPSYTALFPNKHPDDRVNRARFTNALEIIPMDSINSNSRRTEDNNSPAPSIEQPQQTDASEA